MQHRSPLVRAMVLMFGLIVFPGLATAQDGASVVIMKFEALDANAEVVGSLVDALSAGIEAYPEMHVKPQADMTITDLALTAGCSPTEASCLANLRDYIDADRVIFGTVQGSSDAHLFSIRMFDFAETRFVSQITDESIEGAPSRVVTILPALVEGLLYGDVGTLTVNISGADADLYVDGEKVGLAPTTLENLPLGERVIMVRSADGDEQRETVVLRYGNPLAIDFAFAPAESAGKKKPQGSSDRPSIVPGVLSVGVGALGLGLGIFSSVQVTQATADNERLGTDGFVDPETGAFRSSDAVADAKAAGLDPATIEQRAKTFQTLQWVGYGVGAVGVGVGIVLIARAIGSDTDATAALPFDFGVAPTRDGITASIRGRF